MPWPFNGDDRGMTSEPVPAKSLPRLSGNFQGALWILGSCAAGTIMSVGIKELSGEIHTMQITFLRCAVGLVLILPYVLRQFLKARAEAPAGSLPLISRRWPLHLLRGLFAVVAINCGYYSISVLPLATVTVIFFTAPLFVTLLAHWILRERVGWRRWTATGVGFLGALIVLKPSPTSFEPVMLLAIAASLLFAGALIAGKLLSETDRPSTILLYSSVITAVGSLPLALLVWVTPSWDTLIFLALVSVFATARMYFDIKGYAAGEVSFVAPFGYFRLLLMGLAGYLLFAEIPEASAMLGAVVIIGSSLYIAQREARLQRRLSRPVAGPSPD